jgi:hypothetical protein
MQVKCNRVCIFGQIKLVRADKPQLRDRREGAWLAYHVAGGAVTVLDKGDKPQESVRRGPLDF